MCGGHVSSNGEALIPHLAGPDDHRVVRPAGSKTFAIMSISHAIHGILNGKESQT